MTNLFNLKKVLVVGLGISGKNIGNFLEKNNVKVQYFDDKLTPDLEIDWNIDGVYLSPGIPWSIYKNSWIAKECAKRFLRIINDFDLLQAWKFNSKFIGVTGTSGKTTTVNMISHILKQNNIKHCFAGNSSSNDIFEDADIYLLEISSLQLSRIQFLSFDIGVFTNLGIDHIDNHGFYENYAGSKQKFFNNLRFVDSNKEQIFFVGSGVNARKNIKEKVELLDDELPNNLNFKKKHNKLNLEMAISVCLELRVSKKDCLEAAESFKFIEFRQNEKKIKDKIIVNDSKCTNLISLEAAFRNYDDFIWIAGGVWKNTNDASFSIEENFKKFDESLFKKIKKCLFFGRDGKKFQEYFNKKNIESQYFENLEDVVKMSIKDDKYSVILFAPVCASFDQFSGYAERGDYFNALVEKFLN